VNWLKLQDRTVIVTGVANKKSVAWHVGRELEECGARVVYVVRSPERLQQVAKLMGDREVYVCDVEHQDQIDRLREDLAGNHDRIHGLVHSIAFANYSDGWKAFHETNKRDFLQAVDISCFSLINLANALKESFAPDASVVTISISDTTMAAENYGYMAPIKAALDSAVVFLAKSFSQLGEVRFNAVKAGLLKTSASAGIPGYIDSYLYGEAATLRKRGVTTAEVADATLFLLSPRSAGINAQGVVVDAGMGVNYFDRDLVKKATEDA